jgi:hypothetical protein
MAAKDEGCKCFCVGQWQVINFWEFSPEDGEYFFFLAICLPTFPFPTFCSIQDKRHKFSYRYRPG